MTFDQNNLTFFLYTIFWTSVMKRPPNFHKRYFKWTQSAAGKIRTQNKIPLTLSDKIKPTRVPKGFRAPGLRSKISGAPGLQDKNIRAPGLHSIPSGALGFTVIKYLRLQYRNHQACGLHSKDCGASGLQGSRDPSFGTLTYKALREREINV